MMTPLASISLPLLETWLAAANPVPADHTGDARLLSTIDAILFVSAIGILVLSSGLWLLRSRRNPLISAPERPNTVREDAVALAVLAYLLAALILSGIVEIVVGSADSVIGALVRGTGAHLGGIGVCLYLAETRFDGGVVSYCFGNRPGEWMWRAAFALALAVVAIVMCPLIRVATGWGIVYFVPGYEFQTHPTVTALHDASQPMAVKVAFWVGAALVAPVAEEFFFRGVLQTFLVTFFRSRWAAIIVTSILFGSVHFPQPSAIPALTILAVLMGFAYEKTGSLAWPVLIHASFNLKTLVWDAIGVSVL